MEADLQPITKLTRIEIDRSNPTYLDPVNQQSFDDAWKDQCAKNPKCFNGPILAFRRYFPNTGVIAARADQYKFHAMHTFNHCVELLSVTACIERPGPNGTLYLLGKRSMTTMHYGGRWEFGPSGGIVPPENSTTLTPIEIIQSLAEEVREEAGIKIDPNYCVPRSLVHDPFVESADIHFGVVLTDDAPINTNWEYDDTRWMTLDELIEWCDDKPNEIIPSTIAHARFLHQTHD